MPESARLGYYLVTSREAIVSGDGAVDDGGLAVLLLFVIPNLHIFSRLECEGPGIVPLEGPVAHLCMPGPELGNLLLCEGQGWGGEGASHRPAPQPHGWVACVRPG